MRQVSRPHFAKIESQQQFALLIDQGLVDRKVAKIKENVAHTGILPIEDPDSATIVNEIAGKQVIMAGLDLHCPAFSKRVFNLCHQCKNSGKCIRKRDAAFKCQSVVVAHRLKKSKGSTKGWPFMIA